MSCCGSCLACSDGRGGIGDRIEKSAGKDGRESELVRLLTDVDVC